MQKNQFSSHLNFHIRLENEAVSHTPLQQREARRRTTSGVKASF